MIAYQGSKRKEINEIVAYEPETFNTMIDAFGGGGSVFMEYLKRPKKKNYLVIYNDKFKAVYEIVKAISKGYERANEVVELAKSIIPSTNAKLNQLQTRFKDEMKPEQYLALAASCMKGMIKSKCLGQKKVVVNGETKYVDEKRKVKDITEFCDIFDNKNFQILNTDYKELLLKYKNDSKAFIYCDPPYLSRRTSNDNYLVLDSGYVEYIAECMRDPTYKCKIMLNVDFTGHNYVLLKDNIKHIYEKNYMVRKKVQVDKAYHLIATNYEVKKEE